MLTRKQKELLNYIQNFQSKSGVTPSYEEMKSALSLKSKSGIHRLVIALEERGFVKRLAHKARALEVIKDGISNIKVSEKNKKNLVIGNFKNSIGEEPNNKLSTLPLLGKIAAGTPIEAIQQNDTSVDVPKEMMPIGESYALSVEGDSMINEGIHDGDTVLIKKTNIAVNSSDARPSRFVGGERIDAAISEINFEKRKVALSIKLLEELQNKEALSKFSSPLSGKNLPFSSLSEKLGDKKKKDEE